MMTTQTFAFAAAMFAVAASPALAFQADLRAGLGSSVADVKTAYQTPLDPTPSPSMKTSALHLKTKGVQYFFDEAGKTYSVRIEEPFKGKIAGVSIGDTEQHVSKVLGAPLATKSLATVDIAGERTLRFYLDDAVTGSFVLDRDGRIVRIFVSR